jgi:flavodoxin
MKTLIIYPTHHNVTKRFADEIYKRVHRFFGNAPVKSMEDTTAEDIHECDLLFLGGHTAGKFLFGQRPDKEWLDFVRTMPSVYGKKIVLFTSYDVASGSVFRHMKQFIFPKGYDVIGSMKSRNGKLDYFSVSVLKYALKYHEAVGERSMSQLAEVS